MESALMIVIALASLCMVVGAVTLLAAAFYRSVLWGFIFMFAPGGAFAFVILHWKVVRARFLFTLISGLVLLATFVFLPESSRENLSDGSFSFSRSSSGNVAELTYQIQVKRERVFQLEEGFAQDSSLLTKQFSELEKQRKALAGC